MVPVRWSICHNSLMERLFQYLNYILADLLKKSVVIIKNAPSWVNVLNSSYWSTQSAMALSNVRLSGIVRTWIKRRDITVTLNLVSCESHLPFNVSLEIYPLVVHCVHTASLSSKQCYINFGNNNQLSCHKPGRGKKWSLQKIWDPAWVRTQDLLLSTSHMILPLDPWTYGRGVEANLPIAP